MTDTSWAADPSATPIRRIGTPPKKLGVSRINDECPDIWELDNGDIAVVGRDMTDRYAPRMPDNLRIAAGERLVVIPRITLISAKADIPDA